MLKNIGSTLFIFLFFIHSLYAFSFKSELERNQVPLNEQVVLTITLEDDGQNQLKEWALPELTDFQIVGKSTAQQVSVINNQTNRVIKINFMLAAHHEGEFKIPAFTYELQGKNYQTEPLKVVVTAAVAKPRRSINQPIMQTFTSLPTFFDETATIDPVYLETKINKRELYAGEKVAINYFFIHKGRFFDGPNFYAPAAPGLRLKNLNQFTGPANRQRISKNGQEFWSDQLSFIVSPFNQGIYEISPARVEYRQSPFEERQILNGEKLVLTAKNLPKPIPINFSGAVGQFDWQWIDQPKLKIGQGETQTLRVKISGYGNLDPVKTFSKFRDAQESIDLQGRIYAEKTFEWTFTFDQPGSFKTEYPEFIYFDPVHQKYQTLKNVKSFSVRVSAQKTQGQVLDLNQPQLQNRTNSFDLIDKVIIGILIAAGIFLFYRFYQNPLAKLKRKYQKACQKSQNLILVRDYLRDYYLYFYGQSLDALTISQIQNEAVQKIAQVIEEQNYSTEPNKKATDLRPWLDLLKPKN